MDAEASVDENADGGVVTAVTTENADTVTVDNDHFEVADGNLKLKDGNSLDFESDTSPIEVTITASGAGDDATATVSVSINDVNEAPTISIADGMTPDGMEATSTVAENMMGALLGEITLSDEDAGQTHTLSTSDERFVTKQDAEGGWWLALADDASLNYEDGAEVTVTVTVTDSGEPAMSASADVTITVTDVNEAPYAPEVANADNLSVDENDAGASVTSIEATMDPEGDEDISYHVNDSRFEIDGGRVLKLKDGMSLDHENESYVMLGITATDSAGNESEATTITVHVNDVNEASVVTGTVPTVTTESGKEIDVEIDLTGLFTDPDAGDSAVRWELSGNPSWLSLSVEYTTDDDGNETVTGHLRGEPPTTGGDSAAAHKVTLVARDADGAASEAASFYVIVDDGNDEVTGVNLLDDDGDKIFEAEVDENDASGMVFGRITVDDQDHPMHPNGMHQVTVSDRRFEIRTDDDGHMWLALKEGMSLDYEEEDGAVTVRVTAVDMNGELNDARTAERTGEKYKGTSDTASFTVVINDLNDAPEAQTIGNWWVTVDDDLEADQVSEGSWLKFQLESEDEGDNFPAFKDPDGDTLTYSISGPSWLQIDEDDGTITNAEDAVPRRGVYRVTVTATDPDGESGSVSFNLNVALSGPADNYTDDNEEPSIRVTSEPGYREGSSEVRVATFTVTDRDQDIPDHEFAISKVEIISVVNGADADGATDARDATLRDHDGVAATPDRLWVSDAADGDLDTAEARDSAYEGYAGAFRLSDPIKSGNTWTYHIYARDTDKHPRVSTLTQLNHENLDEIEITVRVTDGVGATDEETIDVDIHDVNEKPVALAAVRATDTTDATAASRAISLTTTTLGVSQTETSKVVLYIKLFDVWSDDRDDDDDLSYGASTSGSWIKVRHIGEWGDIKDGPDGDSGTSDDLEWNPTDTDPTDDTTGIDNRLIGTTGDPDDGDVVAIVEIDRTTRDNQGDRGSLTLTARDDDSATGSRTYNINPADQNVVIGAGAVTISGSPREDGTLRARFNDNRDPDLGGSATPALVLYSWYRVDDAGTPDDDSDDTETLVAVTTGNEYRPTQSDVGHQIKVSVSYYEVFDKRITGDTGGQHAATDGLTRVASGETGLEAAGLGATLGGEDTTSRDVSNTPDDGVASFTITADSDTLRAEVYITDGDYLPAPGRIDTKGTDSAITKWQWQVSDNGRGGWTDVDEVDTDTGTPGNQALEDNTLTLANGNGKYYRVVVSYNEIDYPTGTTPPANPPQVEIASHAIRVGNVDSDANPSPGASNYPTISGSPNPGGTLIVNGRGIASVQWQKREFNDTTDTETYWADISGATGTSLSLTSAHAGDVVRAVVTYQSSDPNNPGATLVVLADADGDTPEVQSEVTVGGATATVRPVAVKTEDDPYWIETSVSGTGHARWAHDNTADTAGHTVSLTHTVSLASLFQDTDTPSFLLRFTATGDTATGLGADEVAASTGTYEFANDQGVLVLELGNGKLTYVSDKLRGHDGTGAAADDGEGNWLTLDIAANDQFGAPTGAGVGTAEVRLRINVAPTDIDIERPADGDIAGAGINNDLIEGYSDSATLAADGVGNITTAGENIVRIHLNENQRATGNEVLAELDVQDQNSRTHPFGTHDVTVVGDDRFEVTNTGNSVIRDGDSDGSTWQLRLKPGATFDFEADDEDGNPRNGITEFKITLMATDKGGLSTPEPHPESYQYIYPPAWLYQPITLTIRIINDEDDDVGRPKDENVPGLKDDETTGPDDDPANDETEDDATDSDTDGGRQPPPPGMSLGQIEDFVENMDFGDQDLLEDYLLTIDDGLDIL